MVTVQMGNEDMVDPPHFKPELSQLNLGAFATINEEKLFIEPDNL